MCSSLHCIMFCICMWADRRRGGGGGRMRSNFLSVKYDQFDNGNNQFLYMGYTSPPSPAPLQPWLQISWEHYYTVQCTHRMSISIYCIYFLQIVVAQCCKQDSFHSLSVFQTLMSSDPFLVCFAVQNSRIRSLFVTHSFF